MLAKKSATVLSPGTVFLWMWYRRGTWMMSYEEEDTWMAYEEEDTWMAYEEEDTCRRHRLFVDVVQGRLAPG